MPTPARHLPREQSIPLAIEKKLRHAIADIEPVFLRQVMEDASLGGKFVRPMLTAWSCAAAGGHEDDTLAAGSALELLHASSLVHDDIMDHGDTRRGMPTVYRRHGTSVAILTGDALIALAFRLIQSIDHPRKDRILGVFTTAFLNLCEGQCADIRTPANPLEEQERHGWMVERKTARLLEACTSIGALLATDDEARVASLARFGLSLGLAYQANDDLLDLIGDEREAGKTLRIDGRNGRSTFLTLAYPQTDQVEHVRQTVAAHTTDACRALEGLPVSPARDRLHQLALTLLERRR